MEMSDIYSKSPTLLQPPTNNPSSSRARGKFTKNFSIIEEDGNRDQKRDLLRRQQSVELGRRKIKILPNRSFSLNSRFSSSTGQLNPVTTPVKGRRMSGYDPTFNQARCVNWGRDDVVHHSNNNNNPSILNGNPVGGGDGSHRNSMVEDSEDRSSLGGSQAEQVTTDKQRQMSIVLNIPPSRQASVRSCESGRSASSCSRTNSATAKTTGRPSVVAGLAGRPSKCGMDMMMMRRESRNNSIIPFGMSLKDLPEKERRHRKVAFAVILFSSFLLISAILCIIVSLHRSRHIDEKQRRLNLQYALDKHSPPPPVRKENEHLLKVIHQPASSLNVTNSSIFSGSSTTATLLQSDTNNVSHNNNNNYLINNLNHHSSVHSTLSNTYDTSSSSFNSNSGQSLPRTTDMAEEAAQDPQLSLYHKNNNHNVHISTKIESGEKEKGQDRPDLNSQQQGVSGGGSRKINKGNVHDDGSLSP